jgi:MscS family membrane protein
VTISIIWAVYRGVDVLGARLAAKAADTESKLDDQLIPLLSKSLKVVVFIIGALIILQNLKVDVGTMLAGLSIGGLAFGLAAKDTLANLFGSISIFVDSPFQIGDWINVDGVDGTVEEVGFRSTRIRTFYNSVVVVPNAKLADSKVDNYGKREIRRCFFKVGLTYDTSPEQMQAFVEGMRAIIQSNEYTHKDSYEVHMSGFGDSALEVMVYFFFRCDTWTEELRERHNVHLETMRLAQQLGVGFAFPTQSLHIEALPKAGARERPVAPELPALRETVLAFAPGGDAARPGGPIITESAYVAGATPDQPEEDGA